MSTLAIALKDEIRRLARKEIKAQTGTTAKAVVQHRRQISALKGQVREQDRRIQYLEKQEHKRTDAPNNNTAVSGTARFSARSVRAQRKRTGLSAADYARLGGVSPLTIYNWELGKSRPRNGQLASLVAIRGVGKRQAQVKLKQLKADETLTASKRSRASQSRI